MVNRVDPSGMCWINNTATHNQQQACHAAFTQYNKIIYAQHPDWPIHISELVGLEAIYWGNLPYNDFVAQWNSNRPPASTDPGGELLMSYAPGIVTASFINPALGPDDGLAFLALACVGVAALIAGAGTIALPMRQTYHFSQPNFDWNAAERFAVTELTRRLAEGIILFRGTALSRVWQREGLHDNRLWVFRDFMEAAGYAQRDGLIEKDTAAVAAYAMNKILFDGLIVSGNIRVRFSIEYGLDYYSQGFLIGPIVIPIPD